MLISFAFEIAALHIIINECGHFSNEIRVVKFLSNRNKRVGKENREFL
jgi:hypothetical protein